MKHCQKAVQRCTDSVYSSQIPNNTYCASRIVYNSNLYNGTSSNWKADWARFIGKSYSQVVVLNLDTAKVKAQQISSNTKNSLAVKSKTCRAKNMTQLTFLTPKKEIHYNSSDRKQKPCRRYPNTISTHSSEFQLPLQNRFESIHLPDPTYPTSETNCKFEKNCKQTIQKSPVHKPSTECTKVFNENVRLWQSADDNDKVVKSNTPSTEQGKCKKPHKIGSKMTWPQDKYELALQVKKKNKDKIQLANSDPTFQKCAEQNPDGFNYRIE